MTGRDTRLSSQGRPPKARLIHWSTLRPWQQEIVDRARQMGFGMLRLIWADGQLRYHGEDAIVQDDDLTKAAWVPPGRAAGHDIVINDAFTELFDRAMARPSGTIHHVRIADGLPLRVQLTIPLPLG